MSYTRVLAFIAIGTIFLSNSLIASGKDQKAILLRWDGVIVKTIDPICDFTMKKAKKYGYTWPLKDKAFLKYVPFFSMLDELGFPEQRQNEFMQELVSFLEKNADKTHLVPGIKEEIIKLKNGGYSLNIMCQGPEKRVSTVLNRYELEEYFDRIISISPDSTEPFNLDPAKTLCIIDDLEIARTYHEQKNLVVGACWGMSCPEGFASYENTYEIPLIRSPKALSTLVPAAFKFYDHKQK